MSKPAYNRKIFSNEDFLEAIKTSFSHKEASQKLGYKKLASTRSYYLFLVKTLTPDIKHFRKSTDIVFSDDEFLDAIKSASSHKEALKILGYKGPSHVNTRYNEFLERLKPDTSHFSLLSRSTIKDKDEFVHLESYYNHYKYKASTRNIEFSLSFEEFKTLVIMPCYYCGKFKPNRRDKRVTYQTPFSGIDRIDSGFGYIRNNCVSCCKRCNQAKNDMKQNEFYDHIIDMYIQLKKNTTIDLTMDKLLKRINEIEHEFISR